MGIDSLFGEVIKYSKIDGGDGHNRLRMFEPVKSLPAQSRI